MINIISMKDTKAKRAILIEVLGGRCVNCRTTERLEFDHVIPEEISFRIGNRLNARPEKLIEELQKCQLLCKPCHGEKTGIETRAKNKKPRHGTVNRYQNHECRCIDCRDAWTIYMRNRINRQKSIYFDSFI